MQYNDNILQQNNSTELNIAMQLFQQFVVNNIVHRGVFSIVTKHQSYPTFCLQKYRTRPLLTQTDGVFLVTF